MVHSRIEAFWFVAASLTALGCTRYDPAGGTAQSPVSQQPATPVDIITAVPETSSEGPGSPFHFSDAASSVGIPFVHYSPLTPQRHVHLVMGSGIGWCDFDRDGWPDLYCCQGASFGDQPADATPSNLLLQNQDGERFADVTRRGELHDTGYSMGIAAADYDNDGFADLCVTGFHANTLLHNCGDGTFERVVIPRGSDPGRLSASCAWGDIDADGDLDLYITNYARLGPEDYPICEHTSGGKTIHIACHPSQLDRMPDLLYHNAGDGRFMDISKAAGIAPDTGRQALGVVAADLDADGDTDFYVANDTTPNYLWQNDGTGSFVDRGGESGTATNRHGAREAGMGIAVGDVDGNGELDLLVTNFYEETNTLYRNEGSLLFSDVTNEMGLGGPSRLRLAFGTLLADFDNDGWLDVFVANGHIHDRLQELGREGPFAQLPQLFHNQRGARFRDVSAAAGDYFREPHVGRSSAAADYDRDGDVDIAINHLNGAASLLQNTTQDRGRWIRVELTGVHANREGVGAQLQIDLGDRVLCRSRQAGGSYLACDEGAMSIGIGALDEPLAITVVWPGGRRELWDTIAADGLVLLVEGCGRVAADR